MQSHWDFRPQQFDVITIRILVFLGYQFFKCREDVMTTKLLYFTPSTLLCQNYDYVIENLPLFQFLIRVCFIGPTMIWEMWLNLERVILSCTVSIYIILTYIILTLIIKLKHILHSTVITVLLFVFSFVIILAVWNWKFKQTMTLLK